jgi:hypothetical protein
MLRHTQAVDILLSHLSKGINFIERVMSYRTLSSFLIKKNPCKKRSYKQAILVKVGLVSCGIQKRNFIQNRCTKNFV